MSNVHVSIQLSQRRWNPSVGTTEIERGWHILLLELTAAARR